MLKQISLQIYTSLDIALSNISPTLKKTYKSQILVTNFYYQNFSVLTQNALWIQASKNKPSNMCFKCLISFWLIFRILRYVVFSWKGEGEGHSAFYFAHKRGVFRYRGILKKIVLCNNVTLLFQTNPLLFQTPIQDSVLYFFI